ncbi:hypothetical protein PROSTU_03073 [Providencia stuartii ATCC 25827]|uniref:Uncharacterized protein n=1 Tax=Providencia stuartii ATCC 25827 TaxID=471874 RepID=A0AA87CTJ0_PROST|nr:hypothetical protein PROSTU_03073 [Providencia stuartii ATCC 25827]
MFSLNFDFVGITRLNTGITDPIQFTCKFMLVVYPFIDASFNFCSPRLKKADFITV